jgi:hypothetical protein
MIDISFMQKVLNGCSLACCYFSNCWSASFFLVFQICEVPFSEHAENIVLVFHTQWFMSLLVFHTQWFLSLLVVATSLDKWSRWFQVGYFSYMPVTDASAFLISNLHAYYRCISFFYLQFTCMLPMPVPEHVIRKMHLWKMLISFIKVKNMDK